MEPILNNDIFLSYYGDDFTGSTDVMESLALNGIPAALFLEPPSPEEIKTFRLKYPLDNSYGDTLKAFGVAGIGRSLSPARMDDELPPIFSKISQIQSDFFHYKVCSTFDSSPVVGSIGHATEIALRYFPCDYIPLIVGAPSLNRFCIFGNLFARVGDKSYRLDRHPTMSKHPVTPMNESDLSMHLSHQTTRDIELLDIFILQASEEEQAEKLASLFKSKGNFILFDTINEEHLFQTGKILINNRSGNTQFLVGSSGTEYALTSYLKKAGKIITPEYSADAGEAGQIVVMAGSAAPTTAGQIEWSISRGFIPVRIDTLKAVNPDESDPEEKRIIDETLTSLAEGNSVIIYTALGPDDPVIDQTKSFLKKNLTHKDNHEGILADFQGRSMKKILELSKLRRAVVAGGDTSGYVSRALGIYALETRIPVAPGAPLCTAHSKNPAFDGMQISLKGGQNGNNRYFESILKGKKLD